MDNFKAALRSLLSTPGPTVVVIATLAIAIGANTSIFTVVNNVLLRPLGYGDDSGLVVLWAANESDPDETFRLSPADYRDVRDDTRAFGGQVVLYRSIGSTLTGLDRPIRVGSLTVTTRVFRVLDVEPAAGQLFTDEDEKPGGEKRVVLTHASWTRRFGGDPSIIGSVVDIDSEPRVVVGVTEPGFQFPPGNDEVEIYFPMKLSDGILLDRNHRMFDSVARLADGVTIEAARGELEAVAARLAREFPDTNAGWRVTAKPLRDELVGELGTTLWVLSGAVLLVLLIACANIAGVLVARSTATTREFAVRAALGAGRADLLKRSLAESSLLGFSGGAIGLVLAAWGGAWLSGVMPADIVRGVATGLDARVLLFAATLTVGSTILFGSLPAVRAMASDVVDLLKPAGLSSRGGGSGRVRELMVIVEVALAIVLVVGAGLMVRSFARLSEVDPGFRDDGVVSVAVQLPRSRYARSEWPAFFEQFVKRVSALPGVHAAGAVSDLPMSNVGLGFELEFTLPGLDAASPTARPNADFRLVVPGYFPAIGMRIVRGRDFDALDAPGGRTVAIVNETLADRYFGELDPIGRSLVAEMLGDVTIVGVVSDIRHSGLQAKYESEVYLAYGRPIATNEMHVVVHSDLETAAVASAVGDILTETDPQLAPSSIAAMPDLLWESVAQARFNTALLAGLAFCAAALALVGTYGIVAYTVARRTGEIGVRMALGADSKATVSMILRHAVGVVLAGATLGIVGALGASRFLGRLLFDVEPTDPLTYGVVLVATLVVGGAAAWTPARRATRIDPIAALRDD